MMKPNHSKISHFFANPVVGLVGSLASVLGLILAVYFYLQASRHRELVYFVHPARAVVFKTGQTSRLNITLEGRRLKTDVTAVQVAFWNEGTETIRREHVLQPLVIRTAGRVPIIEGKIRTVSRKVVRLRLDARRAAVGELRVSWNILERDDGGILQIVFAGPPESSVSASAVIEGQAKIRHAKPQSWMGRSAGWALLTMGLLILPMLAAVNYRHSAGKTTKLDIFVLRLYVPVSILVSIISAGAAIYYLAVFIPPEPPFGF